MRAFAYCAGPAASVGIVPHPASRRLPPAAERLAEARVALALADAASALRAFEAALAHEPRLALAQLGRAVCLAQMAREEEAADALAQLFEDARGQEEVLVALARMCAREGQTSFAIPLLTEAMRLKPALSQEIRDDALFADHPAFLAADGRL